MIAVYPPQASI